MKVLSAIGRFFARIGRWIKETAWIQPLLIVGAIFAVIFAIPHIINGVKGWFNDSDSTNAFYAQYRLSLSGADNIKTGEDVGSSEVDKFFTYLADSSKEEDLIKMVGKERFFVAFVEKDSSSAEDLCGGLKTLRDKWNNAEFKDSLADKGSFKLITIYTDTKNNDDENLFYMVWRNHYSLFEDLSNGLNLPNTFYAKNNGYDEEKYRSTFVGSADEQKENSPISTPLLMYFDFTADNPNTNQTVKGLSDVIFSVEGSSDMERARTLKNCWCHTDMFGKIITK